MIWKPRSLGVRQRIRDVGWQVVPGRMADRAVRWQFQHHPGNCEGWTVEGGPFMGLRYPRLDTVSAADSKRRGTYEQPLAEEVAKALRAKPEVFVDIGSAEGYYAVGAARMGVPTIAFESSAIQRTALLQLARENQVQVDLRRHCRRIPKIPTGSLLLMDAEGAEVELLDASAIAPLAGSTVMVELHEMFVPGVTERLFSNFQATHACKVIQGPQEPGRTGDPEWGIFSPRAT